MVTWTVDDAAKMSSVIDAGVDGIMTDIPDRLRAVLEDKKTASLMHDELLRRRLLS